MSKNLKNDAEDPKKPSPKLSSEGASEKKDTERRLKQLMTDSQGQILPEVHIYGDNRPVKEIALHMPKGIRLIRHSSIAD